MKGLGKEKKRLQHNIVDLLLVIPTDPDRWSLHGEWTQIHTQTQQTPTQNHLCMILYNKLDFQENLKVEPNKTNKSLATLRKLQNKLPWTSFISIYESFMRPYLEYRSVIFNQLFFSLTFFIYSIEHCFGIDRCNKRSFQRKVISETRTVISSTKRWYTGLCFSIKFLKVKLIYTFIT